MADMAVAARSPVQFGLLNDSEPMLNLHVLVALRQERREKSMFRLFLDLWGGGGGGGGGAGGQNLCRPITGLSLM